jgi:hypothetical protein
VTALPAQEPELSDATVRDEASDPPASVESAGSGPAPVAPPTRQELREKITAALYKCRKPCPVCKTPANVRCDHGRVSSDDVLADIYASQYNTEVTVTGLMSTVQGMAGSKLGRKIFGRMEKQIDRELAAATEGES